MNVEKINQILTDTAFIRTSGSPEELKCANYLMDQLRSFGCEPRLEAFEVDMAEIEEAHLYIDGKEYPCKGYKNAGSAEIEAPLFYLRSTDKVDYAQCKGKIVLFDGYLGTWRYVDLVNNGAVGFISHNGVFNTPDRDIDQREIRGMALDKVDGKKIPGANINVKDAMEIVNSRAKTAKIVLKQKEFKGESHNVIVDLPGEVDEYISVTAHYDSTPLSVGTYDNMTGDVAVLSVAEHFAKRPHRYGLRMILCGSEERGLLGSKAYVKAHPEDIEKMVLNVNIDMIGSIMGKFVAGCTAEDKLVHYIEYLGKEIGFLCETSQIVYSSDSTSFADAGVPAFTFARDCSQEMASIHTRYDTIDLLKGEQMAEDCEFIVTFVDHMANAKYFPVARVIPDNMKEKLETYLARKRE